MVAFCMLIAGRNTVSIHTCKFKHNMVIHVLEAVEAFVTINHSIFLNNVMHKIYALLDVQDTSLKVSYNEFINNTASNLIVLTIKIQKIKPSVIMNSKTMK